MYRALHCSNRPYLSRSRAAIQTPRTLRRKAAERQSERMGPLLWQAAAMLRPPQRRSLALSGRVAPQARQRQQQARSPPAPDASATTGRRSRCFTVSCSPGFPNNRLRRHWLRSLQTKRFECLCTASSNLLSCRSISTLLDSCHDYPSSIPIAAPLSFGARDKQVIGGANAADCPCLLSHPAYGMRPYHRSQNGMLINDLDPASGRYIEKTKLQKVQSLLSVIGGYQAATRRLFTFSLRAGCTWCTLVVPRRRVIRGLMSFHP